MYLNNIFLKNYRNYKDLSLDFSPPGAHFYGSNGSGKTNILEAIYMLCTGRSQRGASKSDMIHFGASEASVEGTLLLSGEDQTRKNRLIAFDRNNTTMMRINDRKLSSISDWFGTHPIVSFSSSDLELVHGTPDLRRKFIDIFVSLIDKEFLNALILYKKNLALRNKLLKASTDEILFKIYEEKMAEAGSIITEKRIIYIHELSSLCRNIYHEISGSTEDFLLTFEPSFNINYSGKNSWKNVFYTMLAERRKHDAECGFSSFGPHRDDVHFFINNKQAKSFSSQGQCRSLVLSLKIGSMLCLEKHTQDNVIILFDDAVSELDGERAARTYSFLENRGQLFVASPDKQIPIKKEFTHFHVTAGAITST
jgi:DNA replication and repair protein RecF